MSANLNELDPMSPEYDAAMEARQDAEDAEREGAAAVVATETETDQAETEAPAAVVEAEVIPEATDTSAPQKVGGVASKDGSRVLPYSALQAERRAARQERGARERIEVELAQAKQLIDDLKTGKGAAQVSPDELSADELKQLEEFPVIAKMARTLAATREQLAVAKASVSSRREEPEAVDPGEAVQDAIDQVPMLSEWQAVDPVKFARAVEIDGVMRNSPKWRDKPMAARFEHVVAQVADEFDIQIAEPKPRSTNSAEKASAAIASAKRATPNTLSDFKGGQVEQGSERIENMAPQQALARMAQMTDAEIDAHLAKFG